MPHPERDASACLIYTLLSLYFLRPCCSAHKPYPGCSWSWPRGFGCRIWWGELVSPLKRSVDFFCHNFLFVLFFLPIFLLLVGAFRRVPRGLEDVSKYPSLLAELLDSDRRWSEEDVKKLAGGNLLRVFRDVERVRVSSWKHLKRSFAGTVREWIKWN